MPDKRVKSQFGPRMTTERDILRLHASGEYPFDTSVRQIGTPGRENAVSEGRLGRFREPDARKLVTADLVLLNELQARGKEIPSFLEAGPRAKLYFDPHHVHAAIVTCGGLAPGMNCVVHGLVERHVKTYGLLAESGKVEGVLDGFRGFCSQPPQLKTLDRLSTERMLDVGGSMLGSVRDTGREAKALANEIATALRHNDINILYVIGGDGSMFVAHEVAKLTPDRSIVGIPKTMDNDLLWVWQSFGFDSAVDKATEIINTLHAEAESTRRIGVIEVFGAESGFVAANASLASGHVDLALVPEAFQRLEDDEARAALYNLLDDFARRAAAKRNGAHGIVVVAEGVGTLFRQRFEKLDGIDLDEPSFAVALSSYIYKRACDASGRKIPTFTNEPRHHIRAIPANPHDRVYCERLAALAVDNALAGYTDFMISQWLTEYVLVPLALVTEKRRQKTIPPDGIFWKQVVSSTGQLFIGSDGDGAAKTTTDKPAPVVA